MNYKLSKTVSRDFETIHNQKWTFMDHPEPHNQKGLERLKI